MRCKITTFRAIYRKIDIFCTFAKQIVATIINMPDISHYFPSPTRHWFFFVVLLIILSAPIIMGKLRTAYHRNGAGGSDSGKYGFDILNRDASFEMFGKVGLYYIMFLAALEMDMEDWRKTSIGYWYSVFHVLHALYHHLFHGYRIAGIFCNCVSAVGMYYGFQHPHRLPHRGPLRQSANPVSHWVGASMISLLLALIILAAIVAGNSKDVGASFWLFFALKFLLFCGGLIWIIPNWRDGSCEDTVTRWCSSSSSCQCYSWVPLCLRL